MDATFTLWDSLLRKLTFHQSNFLTMLTDEMMIFLISPSMLDITLDTYREAVAMWLERIYTTKGWVAAIKRAKLDDNVLMETCLQNQNQWTVRLAVTLVRSSGHKMAKEIYGERVAEAAENVITKPKIPIIRSISIENLNSLLPSQRNWLESEEGRAEKARYLQRIKHLEEEPELSKRPDQPQYQATKPTSNADFNPRASQAESAELAPPINLEQVSDEDQEGNSEVRGWSKWEGMWIAKPIGMV